jgi:integrase/recombinase XerD
MKISEGTKLFLQSGKSEKNLSIRTIKAYESDLKQFCEYLIDLEIPEVSIDRIREFIDWLVNTFDYSDTTIKRKIATMKIFFNYLEEINIIADSPCRKIRRRYIIQKRLPKVLSYREIRALLKVISSEIGPENNPCEISSNNHVLQKHRNRIILEILFSTGIRIGELVSLNIEDIRMYDHSILIFGKGRKERILFISSDEVLGFLKDYLNLRKEIVSNTRALFLNKNKNRLSIFSVENIFKKYCEKARIKKHYTPHCLRHTMATMLISNGADIRVVQEILGHASIITTQIYTEVSAKLKRKTLEKYNQRNKIVYRR